MALSARGRVERSFADGLQGHKLLHEAMQRFGGFAEEGKKRRAVSIAQPAGGPGAKSGGSDALRTGFAGASGKTPRRGKERRPGSAVRTVADLMRSWGTYPPDPEALQETTLDSPELEGADRVVLHNKVLSGLAALKRLNAELDLTFQETRRLVAVDFDDATRDQPREATLEEISVSLEHQGVVRTGQGKAHSVVLRVPWAFELRPDSTRCVRSVTPSTRACTPRPDTPPDLRSLPGIGGEAHWSDGERRAPGCKMVGDHCHAWHLCLQERTPETLVLQRLGGTSTAQAETPSERPCPAEWLASVEARCVQLDEIFSAKLEQHSQARQEALEVEREAETQPSEGHRLEDYLRDLRQAIRLLGPGLPRAARLLEGAVKGAILAVDKELHAAKMDLARRQVNSESLAEAKLEIEHLRADLAATQQQNAELKKQLAMADDLKQAEIRVYQEKIERLKDELFRLYPDDGSVEGVGYLMETCAKLLEDLEEETVRQSDILDDMGSYTAEIVREAVQEKIQLHRPGRVVELTNGELMLRPYAVMEQGEQVMETELLKVDTDAPIRFRSPMVRRLLTTFQGRDVPKMTVKELESEVDRLYTAKISADSEADAANMPRADLAAFMVEHYLEQRGTVTGAQERVVSILSCIRTLDRNGQLAPMPLKVLLFARFLQFCNFTEVLALPMLNVALQARRLAHAASGRKADHSMQKLAMLSPQKSGRVALPQGKYEDDAQITVQNAWDSAAKALPGGGSVISRRELFVGLMRFAHFPADDPKNVSPELNDFNFLLLIVHDRLRREAAPKMRHLIAKVENRGTASVDEFRDALRDAQILGIDDAIWRSKLCPPVALGQQGLLSDGLVLDYLGGGSLNRLPRAQVSETQLLWASAEAVQAEVRDRMEGFRKIHRMNKMEEAPDERDGKMTYSDFKAILQTEGQSASTIRSIFIASVEASRSCFQYEGDACPLPGALEPAPNGLYGGDVVTLQHMGLAMTASLLRGEQAPDWSSGKQLEREKSVDPPNSPSAQSTSSSVAIKPLSPTSSVRSVKPPRGGR